ncbi:MAG: serine/threonine protein kinase [bacterium]|nr:serine/threonine protein kinase [bacterium]
MTNDGNDRERELFWTVLEQPIEKRADYLQQKCRGDAGLEGRMRKLVAAHEKAEEALGAGSMTLGGPLADPEQIGPFRILERVGEGGMGVVYIAEQSEPVRRKVALKVIKPGMDSAEVIARFESERQALALMTHPGIARIFDGGATDAGLPYFVMEYVPGLSITDYCVKRRLSVADRLRLFVRVCQAVHHAHQKGVIHRDIKPSNVLVTEEDGQAVPKVIDFGVAKATQGRLTERTLHTQIDRTIGTPLYMSPEQADQHPLDVDTRSDVYSLGVMLYELLVGAMPFDEEKLASASPLDVRRMVIEVDPVRPSTRVSKSSTPLEGGAQDARELARHLRGELDWITLKALEKDRTRRYGSAAEFADDVERHLGGEPVLAAPPSAWYAARKFVARHVVAVSIAAGLFVLLSAFAVTMAVQSRRIARERDRVQLEVDTASAVSDFLERLFKVADPGSGAGSSVTARELLDVGAERIEVELADQPVVRARLMRTMGRAYQGLGLYDQARPLLEGVLALREQELDAGDPSIARILSLLAELERQEGDPQGALQKSERALAVLESGANDDPLVRAEILNTHGVALWINGRLPEAREQLEESLAIREEHVPSDHVEIAHTLNNIAILHWAANDMEKAQEVFGRCLEIWERAHGPEHTDVANTLNNLAMTYQSSDPERARSMYERTLRIREKVLEPDHPDVAEVLNNYGNLLRSMKEWDAGRARLERALEIREKRLDPDHPDLGSTVFNIGLLLLESDQAAEAGPYFERSLSIHETANGPDHRNVAYSLHRLAQVRSAAGEHDQARELFARSLAIRDKQLGPVDPMTQETVRDFARFEREQGNVEAAEALEARGGLGSGD